MNTKALTIIVVSAFCMALNGSGALLDGNFNYGGSGPNGTIKAIAVQGDGKILIGGTFTSYNGSTANYLARLNSDGSLDTGFNNTTAAAGGVNAIVIQSDGKILIGGNFTSIKRLTPSIGNTDQDFTPPTLNHYVNSIALDAQSRIVFGGEFTMVNDSTRVRIARLTSSGAVDLDFDPGYGANSTVYSVSVDTSYKVIVGGLFTFVGGYGSPSRPYLARLNANGSLDTGFNAAPNNYVYSARVTSFADSIFAGGTFTSTSVSSRDRFEQFASGTVWNNESCLTGADATVYVVEGSKYLIGGSFTTVYGQTRKGIARINSSSGCLESWNTGSGVTGGDVYAIAVLSETQVLIGGSFTTVEGTTVNRIARLNL